MDNAVPTLEQLYAKLPPEAASSVAPAVDQFAAFNFWAGVYIVLAYLAGAMIFLLIACKGAQGLSGRWGFWGFVVGVIPTLVAAWVCAWVGGVLWPVTIIMCLAIFIGRAMNGPGRQRQAYINRYVTPMDVRGTRHPSQY